MPTFSTVIHLLLENKKSQDQTLYMEQCLLKVGLHEQCVCDVNLQLLFPIPLANLLREEAIM